MNDQNFQNSSKGTFIEPGVQIVSDVYIGSGCKISAEAVIGLHAQLGSNVNVIGKVNIGINVRIGKDCTLVGPLVIENDVIILQGVVIGSHIAENAPQPIHTLIRHAVRVGQKAIIYAGLELQEESYVQAHSRLMGDLPRHCLAEGDPAALRGFICPCSGITENRLYHRTAMVITYLCTVCRQPVTYPVTLVSKINHILLPGMQFGNQVHFSDLEPLKWEK